MRGEGVIAHPLTEPRRCYRYGVPACWRGTESYLRTFAPGPWKAYPDGRVTRLLTKMMQGLRRHLLPDAWTFAPADATRVFSLTRAGEAYEARLLPLKVGGPNEGGVAPAGWPDTGRLAGGFRGFRFGDLGDGVLGLRYDRTCLGNELFLVASFGTAG